MRVYADHRKTRKQGRPSPDPKNWPRLVAVWLKSIEVGRAGLTTDELALLNEYHSVVKERDRRAKELHERLMNQREERGLDYKLSRLRDSRTVGATRNPRGL